MKSNKSGDFALSNLKSLPLKPIDPDKLEVLKQVLATGVMEMRKNRKKRVPLPTGRARDSNTV